MKKTADAHWEYIEALTRATLATPGTSEVGMSVDEVVNLIGFHYKSAFIHGWKHGLEALRAENAAQKSCCAEAASCARDPRSAEGNLGAAVSGAEAARRVLDADNSGETKPRNIADFGSDYGTYKEHIESFLREDR